MTIDWNDSYKIGHPVIDSEHQHVFELAQRFLVAPDTATQKTIAMQLYRHTREHFAHEEALMRATNYPDSKAHTERHNRMIDKLNVISQGIAKDAPDRQALESLVNDWIIHHIAYDDARLAAYVVAR